MQCKDFFSQNEKNNLIFSEIFLNCFDFEESPIIWLKKIEEFFVKNQENFRQNKNNQLGYLKSKNSENFSKTQIIGNNIFIHESVKISDFCTIEENVYIDEGCELRPGAFIRKNSIILKNCLIGNSCEIKNSILLNNVQIPHFNYVGDSIFGNKTHLGAGVIIANLRLDQKNIILKYNNQNFETGLRKFGAILSDNVEIGCNSVLNPGTIIDKNIKIPALQSLKGHIKRSL